MIEHPSKILNKSENIGLPNPYRLKIRELMLALKSRDLIWALSAYQALGNESFGEIPNGLFEELGHKLLAGQVNAAENLAKKIFAIQYAVEALERNSH
jgi:hypothetical protein